MTRKKKNGKKKKKRILETLEKGWKPSFPVFFFSKGIYIKKKLNWKKKGKNKLLLRIQIFDESDAEFLSEILEFIKVLLVLLLVLHLCLYAFEDPNGRWEIVDAPGGSEGGGYDGGGWDEVIGEGIVEVALLGWLTGRFRGMDEGRVGEGGMPGARRRR